MSVEQSGPPDLTNAELRDIIARVAFETSGALLSLRKIVGGKSSSPLLPQEYDEQADAFSKAVDGILDMVAALKGFDLDG